MSIGNYFCEAAHLKLDFEATQVHGALHTEVSVDQRDGDHQGFQALHGLVVSCEKIQRNFSLVPFSTPKLRTN